MTMIEIIWTVGVIVIWGSLGLTMFISTIQSMIYEKKRDKRDQKYFEERMKSLK